MTNDGNPTHSETSQQTHITAPATPLGSNQPDPYLIHPSENPTIVFFSPLLQGDNYASWVRGISKALNAKGKLGFVDGTLPPPTDPLERTCWQRCDDLVSSWIQNSVNQDIRKSCMYAKTAREIWVNLQVKFSHSNAPKLYQLRSSISALKQESLSVTTYHIQLEALWNEYDALVPASPCICGASKDLLDRLEHDRAMEFLQGLHERYAHLRSQILLIEPLPTTQRIFSLVKQEEDQQNLNAVSSPNIDAAALHFGKPRNDPQTSRGSQHKSNNNTSNGNKRQRPYCDYCNRHGHVRQTCYQLHGYPNQAPPPPQRGPSPASSSALAAAASPVAPHEQPQQYQAPLLTADQYSRLLALLAPSSDENDISRTNLAGPTNDKSDWSG